MWWNMIWSENNSKSIAKTVKKVNVIRCIN